MSSQIVYMDSYVVSNKPVTEFSECTGVILQILLTPFKPDLFFASFACLLTHTILTVLCE